jgi:hypothetical protein
MTSTPRTPRPLPLSCILALLRIRLDAHAAQLAASVTL